MELENLRVILVNLGVFIIVINLQHVQTLALHCSTLYQDSSTGVKWILGEESLGSRRNIG